MGVPIFSGENPVVAVPAQQAPQTTDGSDVPLSSDNAQKAAGASGANNITIYRYPETLATDIQYPHYLMFYVNARNDSAVASKRGGRTGTIGDQTNQMRIDPAQHSAGFGAAVGASSLGLAGAKQGFKLLSDQLTQKAPLSSRAIVGAAGAVAGGVIASAAGAGIGASYGKLEKRTLVKIKDVVALYINNPPAVAYKANWSESDMGFAGAFGAGNISDNKLSRVAGGADLLLRAGAAGMPKVAGGPNVRDAMEAISRKVANPYKEQLFKSMGMRQFGFDYTFMPKNPREARNVMNIIRIFKGNMHPEMDKSKLFLVYPSEFSIVYYYKDRENQFLNKISSCVLTDMSVRFGDSQDFTTFKGGFPTNINMRLQFLELEMLTRERVEKDVTYSGTEMGY